MLTIVILFISGYLAAVISGAAGFGGALILLPILANTIDIKSAIPVLTIGQIFGNASRVWFGKKELKWKPIIYFLLTAIPFSIIGSLFFTYFDSRIIKIMVGVLLILIVIYRNLNIRKFNIGEKGMLLGGTLTGFISGIAGSAGPLGAAFFLGLDLTASAYIASEAFTALIMHITKTVVYQKYALIGKIELLYGLLIGVAMILGSWTGKKIIEKLPKNIFTLVVEILLIISGLQLILMH
jgi:uncharacterized membrane protein YfcA